MKIGACQFAVSGNMDENFRRMEAAIRHAHRSGVRLLAFPECALTGYPPRDIPCAAAVDFDALQQLHRKLKALSAECGMHIICGSMLQKGGGIYNAALLFSPGYAPRIYCKRALWGWDRENFQPGAESGVFEINGLRMGLRICYEIRFPEYFRELYAADTALNIVLFYDVSDADDTDRYDLIKSHIRTRAVENVCPLLSVNAIHPHQSAPSLCCDASGRVLQELPRNAEGLLVQDFLPSTPDFGEAGRREISDMLVKSNAWKER